MLCAISDEIKPGVESLGIFSKLKILLLLSLDTTKRMDADNALHHDLVRPGQARKVSEKSNSKAVKKSAPSNIAKQTAKTEIK